MFARKLAGLTLAVIIAGLLLFTSFSASTIPTSGKCGKDVYWKLKDNTLIFYGTGPMDDIPHYGVGNWYRLHGKYEHVVIEEGVTYVGAYAFGPASRIYDDIKTVTIAESVTGMGEFAFDLNNLEGIYITSLEKWCAIDMESSPFTFSNKTALYLNGELVEDLKIPTTVIKISKNAFKNCDIRRVDIHCGVKEVGAFAFNNCNNLKEIHFYGDAPEFGEHIFTLDNVTAYYPADNVTWTSGLMRSVGEGYVTWVGEERVHQHIITIDSAKAPTCTESGITEGSRCSQCGVLVSQEQIPALGHDYEVTTKLPTCTESGFDLYICGRCGNIKQDNNIEPLGHNVKVTSKAPTCLEPGYELHTCSRCQMEERHNEVAPLNHNYGDWEMVKEPTVEEKGKQVRKCQACEATEEREVERLLLEPTQPQTQRPAQSVPADSTELPVQPSTELIESPTMAPTENEAVQQDPEEQVDLMPIVLGVALLIFTTTGMLYLFCKKRGSNKK